MTGFSTTSRWMLPLLLLLIFISLHHSCKVLLHEFNNNVNHFGLSAKNCSNNCSSVHITDKICRCFNLTLSAGECGFPHHYSEALRDLHNYTSSKGLVRDLIDDLKCLNLTLTAQMKSEVCLMAVMRKPVITTKYLVEALEKLKHNINSWQTTTG